MYTKSFLPLLTLSSIARAAPHTLKERQNAPEICQLDPYQKDSWQRGGGNIFMAGWFQDNGEENWLQKMDANTTDDGSGNSNLDCSNINSDNCPGPTLQCRVFTPYNYYYVRQMASQVHGHMKLAHEKLQDYTIADHLAMDKIISDFQLEGGDISSALGIASSSFWLAGSIFGFNPVAGGVLNAIGAIFGIVGATYEPNIPDYGALKTGMEDYLGNLFTKANENIERLLQRIFGQNLNDDILDKTLEQMKFSGFNPDPDFDHSAITRFLSTGAFMEKLSDSEMANAINQGFQQMKRGMIGNLLAGLSVHVLHNSGIAEGDCKDYGMRYIDGACDYLYTIRPGTNDVAKVDWQWLQKLEFDYGFDIQAFYKNIDDCNNGEPAKELTAGNGYPSCMFGMKVVKTSSTNARAHCFADNLGDLPDNLNKDKGLKGYCSDQRCSWNPASQGETCISVPINP